MRFTRWVSEFISSWSSGLRWAWKLSSSNYYPVSPAADKTIINYDLARQLYRNDGVDTNLGAGFCRPIIDRAVEFMGIPQANSDTEETDTYLNEAIERHWKSQLVEMFRNAMRDSKTLVRVWEPLADDPLTTDDEREHCTLSLYEPERVRVTTDRRNPRRITQAIIVTEVEWDDPVQDAVDPQRGSLPQIKTHEIWEVITAERYRYYDKTDNQWLTEWERPNPAKFVPIVEVFNEYDSALGGGQSDLESVYPFIKAFHEVMRQALQAHKYHSIPKLKFKVGDIAGFLRSNFPDTIDDSGKPVPGSTINWQGREVLIMGQEDDLGFVEMKSILADSKTLLEFLIDCISVASETPEWAFMRVEGGTSQGQVNAQSIPFEKRIEKKRAIFQEYIQDICKMSLAMSGRGVERVEINWPAISVESLLSISQAIQQLVMAAEVLLERKIVSENTFREALKQFPVFHKMKRPDQEALDAASNTLMTLVMAKAAAPPVSSLNGGGRNE